jgi:DNA-binding PadR family transcriptional regulator
MSDLAHQLKRGTLEMILLRMLAERPKYGYELVSELEERTQGAFQMKEGTLYPVLYRLEDQGFIEAEWSQPKRGVPRKYYRRTASGEKHFAELRGEWARFSRSIEQLIEGDEP